MSRSGTCSTTRKPSVAAISNISLPVSTGPPICCTQSPLTSRPSIGATSTARTSRASTSASCASACCTSAAASAMAGASRSDMAWRSLPAAWSRSLRNLPCSSLRSRSSSRASSWPCATRSPGRTGTWAMKPSNGAVTNWRMRPSMTPLAVTRSGTGHSSSSASAATPATAPAFQARWPGPRSLRQALRSASSAWLGRPRSASRQRRSSGSASPAPARSTSSTPGGNPPPPAPSWRATSTATVSPSPCTGSAHHGGCRTSCISTIARAATSAASCSAGAAFSAQAVSAVTHQRGRWRRTSNSVSVKPAPRSGASARAQAAVRLIHSCAAARALSWEATWPSSSSRCAARWLCARLAADSASCSQPSDSSTHWIVRSLCGGASAAPTTAAAPLGSCSVVAISRSEPALASTLARATGWSAETRARRPAQASASARSPEGKASCQCASSPCRATARQTTPAAVRRVRHASSAPTRAASGVEGMPAGAAAAASPAPVLAAKGRGAMTSSSAAVTPLRSGAVMAPPGEAGAAARHAGPAFPPPAAGRRARPGRSPTACRRRPAI